MSKGTKPLYESEIRGDFAMIRVSTKNPGTQNKIVVPLTHKKLAGIQHYIPEHLTGFILFNNWFIWQFVFIDLQNRGKFGKHERYVRFA